MKRKIFSAVGLIAVICAVSIWAQYAAPLHLFGWRANAVRPYSEAPRVQGYLTINHVRAGQVIASYGPFKNLIVNAGETALRDCFIATSCTPVQNWKFHGIGTGTTAAAEADTGCQTELTTQYNPDNTRATGTQTNNGANVYRTVGTNAVDASVAITEFCLQSQAATGGGTMWTRIVFSAVNLASGDSLQTTYDLTIE